MLKSLVDLVSRIQEACEPSETYIQVPGCLTCPPHHDSSCLRRDTCHMNRPGKTLTE